MNILLFETKVAPRLLAFGIKEDRPRKRDKSFFTYCARVIQELKATCEFIVATRVRRIFEFPQLIISTPWYIGCQILKHYI